jgi:ligand-binding sensor domain-containing protein
MPLLVALLALVSTLLANPFRWTTYTSGSNVRDLLKTESGLWLGTSGGLVRFDPATGEFDIYNNTRGLAMNSTVGLGEDVEGWIWVVAPDGRITRMNPTTGQTKVISDLQEEIFEVSAMVRVGDEMFLGANNGIYRFAFFAIADNYRVIERVRVLGGFPTGIAVNDLAVFDGYLYAATIAGMARAPLSTQQFSAPAAWQDYTIVEGLPQNNVVALAAQGTEQLWISTPGFTVTFNGSLFGTDVISPEQFEILHEFNGTMYAAGSNSLFRFDGAAWVSTSVGQPGIGALTEMEIDGENTLVVGVADRLEREGGLRFFDGTNLTPAIAPRGLGGNSIQTVEYDAHGDLWASTGSTRPGISKFANESWTAYTRSDSINGHFWNRGSANSAVADNLGGMWFGGNGCGILYHRDGIFYSYNPTELAGFDTTGARLSGIDVDEGYCETRVGKLLTGEILITNLNGTALRPLALVTNSWQARGDNTDPWVYYFPHSASSFDNPNSLGEVLGDPFGRFFVGGSRQNHYTFVCDPRSTLADTSDDDWDSYNPIDIQDVATTCFDDIIPEVLTFAVDKQNYLWVGTPGGAYYSQGGLTLADASSMRFICLYDLPVGLRVNDIHVDSQDNKWFATDQGVAVLDPTFTWIHVFQTSSSIDYASDLASNNVTAITSDATTGDVWIATSDGLSRLQTPYISREPELDEVSPYPNPFRADGSQHMFLEANSLGGRFNELRVFTLGGRLVREIPWSEAISDGWDGRNAEGDFVAGGVYLLVATTEDGHSATGKVAVLGR